MPETKYEYYAALAERTARQLTENLDNWTSFLDTAARLYKYPYHEQLMIYAQRPDATACADYDTWSKTMRRYIRRGTKGIALIDNDSDVPKLKYVYDLADTGIRQNSRPVNLWQMNDEHLDSILYMFDRNYDVTDTSLNNVFEEISAYLAEKFWDNHRRDIIGIVENSFLEEYTDDTIGVRFREAVTVSTTYTIMARCGMESHFTHEDFLPVFEFNTPDTIATIGTAISEISEQILRDIEITIKTYERMKEYEEQSYLHDNGRLSVPEPDIAESPAADLGQVRENAPRIPEEAPSDSVQQTDPVGEAALPPDGDRHDGEPQTGTDDGRAETAEQSDGGNEIEEPDAVGADDEQPEITSGGSNSERTDLQLIRGSQISLFDPIPTEAEQIEYIDKAERVVHTPFAFSFSQDEIDVVLKYGSNSDNHRKRIVAEFMKQKSMEGHAEFLQSLFRGGNGYKSEGREICAWYDKDGIHLAQGRSAKYLPFAQVISWSDAAVRINDLLEQGQYASNTEIAEAPGNERMLAAQRLMYMHQDMTTAARAEYFSEAMFAGSFDDARDRIAGMLADEYMRDTITNELARFVKDYVADHNILRFRFHKPNNILKEFEELALMNREFTSEITEMPPIEPFITEDEINESFTSHGSGVSGGKLRIYEYLTADHPAKDKISFLKNEYGIGGHSHAVSGATFSNEWHDSKGIRLRKSGCYDVQLSWQNTLKRLEELIRKDRYLTQDEKDALAAKHSEKVDKTSSEQDIAIEITVNDDVDEAKEPEEPIIENVEVYSAEENHLPYDVVIQTIRTDEPAEIPPENFRITDDNLGTGGAKAKFRMNMDAINTLKQIESENRHATPEEQEILSKYVGWGGLADAFDDSKENWQKEFLELYDTLEPEEYTAARSSTLNAHYTSPTVIKAIYEAIENMGFQTGNILEPSMGVGNFFGLLPEEMAGSKLYGVELDSITGRIAKQLYPNADITVAGFETTDRRDFFDLAVGNVPFGNYKVNDRAYNKLGFSIHDYFFAKTLDQVRPGGVIAFVTSRYTMDKQSPEVRKYIAERADLLGAIRLPNNAFKANAGTEVVSDILFLQKRDRPQVIEPDWVHLGQNADRFAINSYFIEHPEMILGRQSSESTQYGHQDFTVEPLPDVSLADQLHEAVKHISGQYKEAELPDLGDNEAISETLPADPNVKNYSYTVVDGDVYYRENSIMVQPNLNATAKERVKGMVELRDCVHDLIDK